MNQRQFNIQRTPLPIESVFTQEDIACNIDEHGNRKPIHDNIHWNRYDFDYPPEWQTSEIGESIVGVRSISLIKQPRIIAFNLHMRKYLKNKFLWILREKYPEQYGEFHTIQQFLDAFEEEPLEQDDIEEIVHDMGNNLINQITIPVSVDMSDEDSLDDLLDKIEERVEKAIEYHNKIFDKEHEPNQDPFSESTTNKPLFVQNKDNIIKGYPDTDFVIECDDDKQGMTITFKSYRNCYGIDDREDIFDNQYAFGNRDCFVDFMITNLVSPDDTFKKKYDPETFKLKDEDERVLYNEDDDMFDDDFVDVFNIGGDECNEDIENKYLQYLWFDWEHEFINIWHREPCEVHASFANQSNHNYLGHSDVMFIPIKYYKLNARDNRFWIEFYDKQTKNPIKIPKHECFTLEMQFMQNDKLLYI